jgi:geranylgeranyl pyrophosphate synthase
MYPDPGETGQAASKDGTGNGSEESKMRGKKQVLTGIQALSAPLDYLLSLPGKGFRGELMSTFNQWFRIPEAKLDIIKNIVELLHTASLL